MSVVTIEGLSHFQGEKVDSINFENSGLNWGVVGKPIFCGEDLEMQSNRIGEKLPILGYKAIMREDNNQVLNVSKSSYEIIQNSRIWEAINNALAGLDFQVISTLTYMKSKRIAIVVRLRDAENYLVNGDEFKNYITFVSSHDGSLTLMAYDTSLRLACMNALQVSRLYKGILDFRVMHTKNAEMKITGMEEQIERLLVKREEFYSSYKYLTEKPMSATQAEKIIAGFLGGETLSTRAANQTIAITDLFQSGKGNNGQTVADLFNGVTEYYTHHSAKEEKQFSSSEFGSGANKKVEFAEIVFSDELLNKLAQKGEKLIEDRKLAIA